MSSTLNAKMRRQRVLFRDLPVGSEFEFALTQGPWVKTSSRKYARVGAAEFEKTVGSIDIDVLPVEESTPEATAPLKRKDPHEEAGA